MRLEDVLTILVTIAIILTGWALHAIFSRPTQEEEVLRAIEEHRKEQRK